MLYIFYTYSVSKPKNMIIRRHTTIPRQRNATTT